MGFSGKYERIISASRYSKINQILKKQEEQKKEGKMPQGYRSILPFFGFTWDTDFDGYVTGALGGNLEINHKYGDTYEIKKTPVQYTGVVTDKEIYRRSMSSSTDPSLRELEDKFADLFEKNGENIWRSKYICQNLEEFYKRETEAKSGVLLSGCLVNMLLYAIGAVSIGVVGAWIKKNWLVGVIIVIITVACWLAKSVKNSTLLLTSKNNEKHLNKMRKKYYKSMVKAYGKEMGEILKEYSILRAKIENKMY